MAAAGFLAGEIMQSQAWVPLSMVVMALMLHRFFLPTRFQIDSSGVQVSHGGTTKRLSWMRVRRFVFDQHGGILDTRATESRFNRSRLQLMFARDQTSIVGDIKQGLELFASPDVVIRDLDGVEP